MIKYKVVKHEAQVLGKFLPPGTLHTEFHNALAGLGKSEHEAGEHALELFYRMSDPTVVTTDDAAALEKELSELSKIADAPWGKLYFVTIMWRIL
jgi:hypothetical protein